MLYHRHEQISAVRLRVGRNDKVPFGKPVVDELPKLHAVAQAHERIADQILHGERLSAQIVEILSRDKNIVELFDPRYLKRARGIERCGNESEVNQPVFQFFERTVVRARQNFQPHVRISGVEQIERVEQKDVQTRDRRADIDRARFPDGAAAISSSPRSSWL